MNKYKKLKVLVIGTTDFMGGAAGLSWALGEEMAKRGVDVKYIVGYKKSHSKSVYELKRNKLLSFFELKTRFNIVALTRSIRAFLLANDIDFGASKEILEHPWYKDADIVQCHNLHGNYFKLRTLSIIANQKPTVWTLHDGWALTAHCAQCVDCKKYNNGKHFTFGLSRYGAMLWDNSNYLWNQKKKIYNNSPKINVVVPSKWLASRVSRSILKDKPLTVINNGVDVNIFRPRDKVNVRKELNLPLGKKIVAYIGQMGTLDPSKGSAYFLETANNFLNDSNIIFLCIGGIVGDKPIQKDNIIYTPYIFDKNKLSHYYSSADILLIVSLAESFSLVTAEALASGLPVVSFDVGGIKEQIVHKENGYIAKYENEKDIVDGIDYILSLDETELKTIEENNRNKAVNKFSLATMTDNYMRLYETVIGNKV